MIKMKTAAAPLLALALGFATQAQAASPALDYGTVASDAGASGRVIEVTPETRYLNVTNGEVVTIRVGDANFTWQVNAAPNVDAVPLAGILPAGTPVTGAWVYIAPGEHYENN